MPEPEAVVAEMVDSVLRGDVDAALALISPTAIDHSALPGAPAGHAGWIEKWTHLAAAADGLTTMVDQRVSRGDTVATRYRIARADTGAQVGFALDMMRVEDGKVAEHWALPMPSQ